MSFGIPTRNGLSLGLGAVPTLATNFGLPIPSLSLDYTIPSDGTPGVVPGFYQVDNGFGVLTQTTFSSLITFSRASNATRFSPTGQLEYAPHNLLLQSQDFATTWSWTRGSTTANTSVAPDGTLTGDKLVPNTDNNSHRVVQTVTTSAGTWTFSAYLKKGEYSGAEFRIADGTSIVTNSGTRTTVDLLTGSLSSTSFYGPNATAGSASIVDAGNDWYRVSVTVTVTSSAGSLQGQIFVQSVAGTTTYAGDGTSGIYAWGAQLAVGPNALDYTPTTTAVVYGPRFDYDHTTLQAKGLLIEEQRTNSIRNNTMVGAVAGTPGTLPTNWTAVGTFTGLTQQIVGVGTENGITYLEIKVSGTPVSSASWDIRSETTTQVVAANGQTWTKSVYIKLVAGSLTNITLENIVLGRDSGGAFISGQIGSSAIVPTNSVLSTQRTSVSFTFSSASVAYVLPAIRFNFTSGAAVDITLRIGLPQLEQGAFATSVIPTTTAATTRSADIASIGTLSPWYNATAGTLYAEFQWETTYARNNSPLFRFDDGTNNNLIQLGFRNVSPTAPGSISSRLSGGATAETTTGTVSTNDGLRHKFAGAYAALELAFSADAQAAGNAVITGVPTVNIARLGASNTGIATQYAIYIRRITYTPRRLTDAELQSLTS